MIHYYDDSYPLFTKEQFEYITDRRQVMPTKTKFELPFKGTASRWWSSDGRLTSVKELDDTHLINIFSVLHDIADDKLIEDNPYGVNPDAILDILDKGGKVHLPRQREIWLIENCITYSALRLEAIRRGIWNPIECIAESRKASIEDLRVNHIRTLERDLRVVREKNTALMNEVSLLRVSNHQLSFEVTTLRERTQKIRKLTE